MKNISQHAKNIHHFNFNKNPMKNLKLLLLALTLGTTTIATTQAAEPTTIQAPKQVAGYYHHQMGNTQITALLDGTNYLNPSMFKGLSDSEKSDILKNMLLKMTKAFKLQSMPFSSIQASNCSW